MTMMTDTSEAPPMLWALLQVLSTLTTNYGGLSHDLQLADERAREGLGQGLGKDLMGALEVSMMTSAPHIIWGILLPLEDLS